MTTRERLVDAAAGLFYEQGVHSSGIDEVVRESGLSKPTLYKYFRSKEDLVTAVVELWARNRETALTRVAAESTGDPRLALRGIVEFFVSWYSEESYRGCGLINTAIELPTPSHPGREVVRKHKAWMTRFLQQLAEEAGLARPRDLAELLVLLEEGATVMAYVGTERSVGRQLRRGADALLTAHGG
jgi:AcrR family transcriptional regulator